MEVPVPSVFAAGDQLRSAFIAQSETGSVGINPGAAAIAHRQTNATFARSVNAVKSLFLGSKGGFRRIDFEKLAIPIKLCQSHYERALEQADRHSFVTQRHEAQHCALGETHEVS